MKKIKKRKFNDNDEYFRFIEKHRGEITYISVQWTDKKIKCEYALKERRKSNGKVINNLINTCSNNIRNKSRSRDSK